MVAIVIPYYKRTFFEKTLSSLAHQTNQNFKVYIGDDASPESPNELLENYRGSFNFNYHRFDHNLGKTDLAKQWERCIELSNEEDYIMIMGDDDYLGETVIASWYKNYSDFYNKSEVIRFATRLIIQEKNEVSALFNHPTWESATNSYLRKINNETRSSLSEYIFSRRSFEKYRFYNYPLAWNSDDHAWLDFSDNKPIFTINEAVVFVRLSKINISGRNDNDALKNKSQILFYKYLIRSKLNFYSKSNRLKILRHYENEILFKSKLIYPEWFFLLFYYIKHSNFEDKKKFLKRFLKIILRLNER